MMQQVWREGNRIRRSDGTGYGDVITDDEIREHIDAALRAQMRAQEAIDFGRAVLKLRAHEDALVDQ